MRGEPGRLCPSKTPQTGDAVPSLSPGNNDTSQRPLSTSQNLGKMTQARL